MIHSHGDAYCFESAREQSGWTTAAYGPSFSTSEEAMEACLNLGSGCAAVSQEYLGSHWRLQSSGEAMYDSDATLFVRSGGCVPPGPPTWPPIAPLPAPPGAAWTPRQHGGLLDEDNIPVFLLMAGLALGVCIYVRGLPFRNVGSPAASGNTEASTIELAEVSNDDWAPNDAALSASRGEKASFNGLPTRGKKAKKKAKAHKAAVVPAQID